MPTLVTLYAGPKTDSTLSFYPSEGATEITFELADGYRVDEGFTGVRMILGAPGTLGMTIDQALSAKVLRPVFDKRLASVDDATVLANLRSALSSTGGRLAVGDWVHFHESAERFARHFGRPGEPCPHCDAGSKPSKVLTCTRVEADGVDWDVAEHVKGAAPYVTTKIKLDI